MGAGAVYHYPIVGAGALYHLVVGAGALYRDHVAGVEVVVVPHQTEVQSGEHREKQPPQQQVPKNHNASNNLGYNKVISVNYVIL